MGGPQGYRSEGGKRKAPYDATEKTGPRKIQKTFERAMSGVGKASVSGS